MKTKTINLYLLKNDQAYRIYWEQFYKCQPRVSTIEIIDLNLEIIVDKNQTILAYRHDLPDWKIR